MKAFVVAARRARGSALAKADAEELTYAHPDLPAGHPHLSGHDGHNSREHTHRFVIDDLQPAWPA